MAGKGDKCRPQTISRAEAELRWNFTLGKITHSELARGLARLNQRDLLAGSRQVIRA